MNTKIALTACLATVSIVQSAFTPSVSAQALGGIGTAYKISGPYQSKNLSVFLIKGNKATKTNNIITLQQALSLKKVAVSETGDVNNLAIENLSNETVFIQSGDIVKGGRQDRTMQYDMLLPPHSGKVPLPAFCVEQHRWSGRQNENGAAFQSSENSLVGKDLKLAARKDGDQLMVWDNVAKGVNHLAKAAYAAAPTVYASAAAQARPQLPSALPPPALPSLGGAGGSLELTLEDKKVKGLIADQVHDLEHIADGKDDVIGYAIAINGKINSFDVYASHDLFAKVWSKQLKSAAMEASEALDAPNQAKRVEPESVRKVLVEAEKARPSRQAQSNKQTQLVDRETKENFLSQTTDKVTGNLIHENLIVK